jgi:hypothetical protein
MTLRLLSLGAALHAISALAQNLVLNLATGWSSYRGSPDLFNGCATDPSFAVPGNLFGTVPAAEGVSYVGMYAYRADLLNRREYVGAALVAPLTPNVPTQVSFKVTSCGGGGALFPQEYWCNGIGVKFFLNAWYEPEFTTTTLNEADVYADQVVPFSSNWFTVSGTFVPDTSYTHIVVGNFFSDALTTTQTAVPPGSTAGAYYYIDDICVRQGTAETCHLTTSVQNSEAALLKPAYFDPNDGLIHVPVARGTRAVDLMDASGRLVGRKAAGALATEITFTVGALSTGVYVVVDHGTGRRTRIVVP